MKSKINILFTPFVLMSIVSLLMFSCNSKPKETEKTDTDKFETLITYIETSGDFINTEESPAAIGAREVMEMTDKNIHIIDIRPQEDYDAGHLPTALRVPFKDLIDYFENKIDPTSFEGIYLFSSDGQAAFFASGLLRLLGYNNVFPVRYGMSAVDQTIAEQYWLKQLSSAYEDKLVPAPFKKPEAGTYPIITSEFDNGYDILRERAIELLQHPYKDYVITAEEVFKNPSNYFIMCYWKEDYYNLGHIPGAIHYAPKKSLSRSTFLSTLPTDKTIVIYCNSGNHSSTVSAYLRILGYDAKSLYYGGNSFMYTIMVEQTDHAFTTDEIKQTELKESQMPKNPGDDNSEQKKPVQGGC